MSGEAAVLRRVLREVLDAGAADCTVRTDCLDSACSCEPHRRARDVWARAEALLAGAIDGAGHQ